jgi:hypothetical protein
MSASEAELPAFVAERLAAFKVPVKNCSRSTAAQPRGRADEARTEARLFASARK